VPHRRGKRPPAPPPVYTFDPARQTYKQGGRGITSRAVVTLRNDSVNASMGGVDGLAARLSTGQMDIQAWTAQMRTAVKDAYTQQYLLGRGGKSQMTQADWGSLGNMLRDQYKYLDNFAREIAAGKLSPAQIQMRARMYIDSAVEAFERGKAAGRELHLPAYPGDGKTPCRVRCKCAWRIKETPEAWYCYWTLGHAEHCDGCLRNAGQWNPLVIPRYTPNAR